MYSILMAKQLGCELKAVYVVDTATIRQLTLSKFLISDESNNYEKSLEEEGKKLLESVVQLSKQKGVKIQTEHSVKQINLLNMFQMLNQKQQQYFMLIGKK